MWLPKDEKRLLRYYWLVLREMHRKERFSNEDLVTVLGCESIKQIKERANKWNKGNIEEKKQEIKQTIKELNRVAIANRALEEQKLIVVKPHESEKDINIICLTSKGYKHGKKCSSKLGTLELWCKDYMWLWIILGVIIGLITLVVTIFKS